MTRGFAAACVLGAVLVLAGCGGSDKSSESTTTTTSAPSPAEQRATYANNICGALLTWKNSLSSVATTLQGGNLDKAKLKDAASTVSDANNKLADDVDALGTPKIGGPQAKSALETLTKELRTSADQIQTAADGVTNTASALTAVGAASSSLLKMSTDISTAITQLQNANVAQGWKQAFTNSASCKSLSSSS